jgi:hypothetical protein
VRPSTLDRAFEELGDEVANELTGKISGFTSLSWLTVVESEIDAALNAAYENLRKPHEERTK